MAETNSWVVCSKPMARARLRLFCFPYAGGGASLFRSWADDFPASIEVCSIQLPGREGRLREPLFTRLEPLVEALAGAIQPYLDRPFAFWGHSLGALVSFELARWLAGHHAPGPLHLFASAHTAPQTPATHEPVHQLPEPEFIREIDSFNGTPAAVLQNAELMALYYPVLRADFAINETYVYVPGAPLDCPISAFGGLADSAISRSDLEAWREQTRSTFVLRMFPGDHFFLHSARSLLLRAVVQVLESIPEPGEWESSSMTVPDPHWRLPPADLTLSRHSVHIWRVSFEQPAALIQHLKQLLAPDECQRADRFHFERDRRRFIIGRGALRTILGGYLKVAPDRLQFGYGPYGKPALAEEFKEAGLRFNLAHSNELAVYAFAVERELGVDVEYLHPLPDAGGIAARFFSAPENTVWSAQPESRRLEAFFNCWTRKEAYIKAIGEGLSHPLDAFQVSLAPGEPAQLLQVDGLAEEAARWSMAAFVPAPGYVAALALEGRDYSLEFWQCFAGQ